jgi:remodeling and spacing factor 1
VNGVSSSSSDEHQPSDDEDEYNSDDYLPNQQQADELNDEELLEEDDDNDDEFVPRRSAKTVAKRRGQISTENIADAPAGSSACYVCSKTDRPESLLLCDDCDDAYHLECLKPALLSVPEGDWYCPLCEHKRLCDSLVDKFIQLLKDYDELEVKRSQCISKRTNRLANVMLNLDRMVKRSSKKRRTNGIVCSDDDDEEEEEEEVDNEVDEDEEKDKSEEDDDDDDDSVYGFRDDGGDKNGGKSNRVASSSRRSGQKERHHSTEPERLGVRSCRRKPQNYRFDDYDQKMKEAMIDAGAQGDEIEKESGMLTPV